MKYFDVWFIDKTNGYTNQKLFSAYKIEDVIKYMKNLGYNEDDFFVSQRYIV